MKILSWNCNRGKHWNNINFNKTNYYNEIREYVYNIKNNIKKKIKDNNIDIGNTLFITTCCIWVGVGFFESLVGILAYIIALSNFIDIPSWLIDYCFYIGEFTTILVLILLFILPFFYILLLILD